MRCPSTHDPARALALALCLTGCTNAGADESDDATSTTGQDEVGDMCYLGEPLEHRISLVESGGLADGTYACELVSADLDAGSLTIELGCTSAEPAPVGVTIVALTDVVPPGLEPGAQLSFVLLDGIELGDPELSFELRDEQGPILAMVQYSYGATVFEPIVLSFATYCLGDLLELDWTGENNGYIHAEAGGQSVDVLAGTPEILALDGVEWEIHTLLAMEFCCEGSTLSAELFRRATP